MPTHLNPDKAMNPKQELFVENYIINGFRPAKAAEDAGYSSRSCVSIAQRLLKDPRVRDAINKRKEELFGGYQVTAERVIKELALLGFSNMQDYITVADDGSAYMDLSRMTREQAAAISELNSEVYVEKDSNGRKVKKCRIKLAEKRGALELLGKHVGVFKEGEGRTVQVRVMYDGTRNQAQVDIGVKE